MDGGKLSEVNARTESRRQNELVGKFKMAAIDLVSVRRQVMEYMYIPTGIKGEMVRSGMDCHRKGQVVGIVGRRLVAIHSSGQTISSLAHTEGITLGDIRICDIHTSVLFFPRGLILTNLYVKFYTFKFNELELKIEGSPLKQLSSY